MSRLTFVFHSLIPIAAVTLLVSTAAIAQEWEYLSVDSISGAKIPGQVKVTEDSPGKFKLRFYINRPANCFNGDLSASIAEEDTTKVITVEPRMGGCDAIRLVVNKDGSGGKREVKGADGVWKWDGVDRGLKLKQ